MSILYNYEKCFCNLRLLSKLKENQYLSTSSSHDILCYIDDSYFNSISSFLYRETYETNLKVLHKLFVVEIPVLVDILIREKKVKELFKLETLLNSSKKGVINLKILFTSPEYTARLDTILDDYIETQLSYIEDFTEELA